MFAGAVESRPSLQDFNGTLQAGCSFHRTDAFIAINQVNLNVSFVQAALPTPLETGVLSGYAARTVPRRILEVNGSQQKLRTRLEKRMGDLRQAKLDGGFRMVSQS